MATVLLGSLERALLGRFIAAVVGALIAPMAAVIALATVVVAVIYRAATVRVSIEGDELVVRNRLGTKRVRRHAVTSIEAARMTFSRPGPRVIVLKVDDHQGRHDIRVDASASFRRSDREEIGRALLAVTCDDRGFFREYVEWWTC